MTLAHEALIKEWPRLQLWIDEDRDFRQWQERLRATIWQWENSKKDQNALLRGKLLIEAEDWLQQRRRELHLSEREFIEKSREREGR